MDSYMTLIFSGLYESKNKLLLELINNSIAIFKGRINDPNAPEMGNWIEVSKMTTYQNNNLTVRNESKEFYVWLWSDLFKEQNIIGEIIIPSNVKSKDDITIKISSLTHINDDTLNKLSKEIKNIYP